MAGVTRLTVEGCVGREAWGGARRDSGGGRARTHHFHFVESRALSVITWGVEEREVWRRVGVTSGACTTEILGDGVALSLSVVWVLPT